MLDEVRILDGSTFFTSDLRGDALGIRTHGLFHRDTRFLSVFRIEIDGVAPQVLSTHEVDYYSAAFFLAPEFTAMRTGAELSVVRNRFLGGGLHEDILITNYSREPVDARVTVVFDSDFADLFEIKEGIHEKKGEFGFRRGKRSLVFSYRRDGYLVKTVIMCSREFSPAGGEAGSGGRLEFDARIEPLTPWKVEFDIGLVDGSRKVKPRYTCRSFGMAQPLMRKTMSEWLQEAPTVESSWDLLDRTYHQSIVDLAALRFEVEPGESERPPAAGLPWFMALFGRDSLITAYQSMILGEGLARSALRSLARRQAADYDDFHDREPGKILHELRFGELTRFGKRPHSPYYGSIDSTLLFLIVLHEAWLWSGDFNLLRELEGPARAALGWIEKYADLDGDGYLEYQKRSSHGLDNQHWKDSYNSVLFHDGRMAQPPIASAEVQGYLYDAWERIASVAGEAWGDPELAASLKQKAAGLKARFNRDFWIDDGSFFALALDKEKRQVDSMTSNMGQLLWTGIVDTDKARLVANRLMDPSLWSGWGIRTMSVKDRGFSPIEYHNGTIWPHDNSLIAVGLVRYGFKVEAARIMAAMIEAAEWFDFRLPETFAGYSRKETNFPVRYPTACIPQAWAAASPLLFLRAVLGLEPDPVRRELSVKPLLPPQLKHIWLKGVHAFGRRFDIEAHAEASAVEEE